jgi:hypothetical protein
MMERDLIHPEFLTNRNEYAQTIAFWRELWESINPELRADWVTPWLASVPEALQDGNPIFSAISRSQHRALRIIQLDPADNGEPLQSWIDWFGQMSDAEAVHEFVIACTLSQDVVPVIKGMIESWVARGRIVVSYEGCAVESYVHDRTAMTGSLRAGAA